MAESTSFQYTTRLAPDEIRLLSLIPSSTNPNLPLQFSLQTTTLHSTGPPTAPYIALSYVWGSESNPLPILINDHPHLITRNLHAALLHLATNELESRPLWADAICINQSDETEKLAQIARMADVYRGAERVVVFLGPGDAATDRVIPQMERIGGDVLAAGAMIFRESDLRAWPAFDGCERREEKARLRRRLEGIMDRERGGGLFGRGPGLDGNAALDLFARPWFARAWIIQEICLAPEGEGSLTFACGDRRIVWERLWAALLFLALWILREGKAIGDSEISFLRSLRLKRFVWRMGMVPRPFSARAAQTLGIRKKYLQGDLQRSLKGLLISLYVADSEDPLLCRDPEDKIRALRGLASDGEILDGLLVPGISWNLLCTRLARHFYARGDLDFLSLCRHRSTALPSWATNWTQQQRPPWLGYTSDGGATQLFHAGKGTTARVYTEEGDEEMSVLCLEGFIVDTLQEVGSEWTADLSEDFSWASASLRILELDRFLSISQLYSPAEKRAARWRILVADRIVNDLQQPVRAGTTQAAEASFAKMETIITSTLPGEGLGAWYYSYRNTLMSLWSSRPFLSSKGYIGLCPGQAAKGDTVIVPSGSHCPYIVRKSGQPGANSSLANPRAPSTQVPDNITGEAWELLGEGYVHGVMDGELNLGSGAVEAERIRLA